MVATLTKLKNKITQTKKTKIYTKNFQKASLHVQSKNYVLTQPKN